MGWCRVIPTWPRGLLWQGLALPTRAALAWSQHPAGIGPSCCGRRGFSQLLPRRSRAGSDLPLINQEPKQNRQLCQRQLCRRVPNSSGLTAASSFFCIAQESFKSNTAQRTAPGFFSPLACPSPRDLGRAPHYPTGFTILQLYLTGKRKTVKRFIACGSQGTIRADSSPRR